MVDLYICQKLLKVMKEREESLHEILCYGAVKDFQEFEKLRAKLHELNYVRQELTTLLERVETQNE